MRNFLIAVGLGTTALTFYSALAYKSKIIEQDITQRVTEELVAANAKGVDIDVDGRHVTLSGIVYDEAQERSYLDTANDTYGALGPIDGLTYQADGGFVTAEKTGKGIALRGSVPNEDVRASLLASAAEATDGEVEDQLTISGPEADWQGETSFGLAQLGALSTGTLTASAAGFVLSGTTDGDVAAVTEPVSAREGWSAFVSSPQVENTMKTQIDDLNGVIADRDATIGGLNEMVSAKDGEIAALTTAKADLTGERDALSDRLAALEDGMSDELASGENLRAELASTQADLDTATTELAAANEVIVQRDKTIAEFNTDQTTLISRALESDNALEQVQAELSDTQGQLAETQGTLQDTQTKLTGATATIAALTANVASQSDTIGSLNTKVEGLETELANRQAALGSTDEQVAALRALVSEKDQGLNEADQKITTLMGDLGARDETIASLSSDVAAREGEIATLTSNLQVRQGEIDALNAALEDKDAKAVELGAKISSQEADLYTLKATVDARDTTIANLNEKLTDTSSNLASDNDRIAALAADLQERDSALAGSRAEVEDLNGQLGTLNDQIGALQGTVAERDETVAEQAAEIAALNDAVAVKDDAVSSLTNQIGALESAVADRDAALKEAQDQGAALTAATAAKEDDLAGLNAQVEELSGVVAARDATIAALRSQGGNANVAEQCATQASRVMEGARINFGSGNARIQKASDPLLERLTGIALACVGNDLVVEIGGHTDSQGSDADNQELSERRAQAVLAFMTERGVPTDGIRAVGYGESQPIGDNATAAGRAENRRITFEWQAR